MWSLGILSIFHLSFEAYIEKVNSNLNHIWQRNLTYLWFRISGTVWSLSETVGLVMHQIGFCYFSTHGNIHHNLLKKNTNNHFPVYTHCKHFPDSLLASALIANLAGCAVPNWGFVFVKAFCFSFAKYIFYLNPLRCVSKLFLFNTGVA